MKGYRSALLHVFFLCRMDIALDQDNSRMFSSFKKPYPRQEIKPLERNLSLVLRSSAHLPYEPLNNDNSSNLGFILITAGHPFFRKRNSPALFLNRDHTYTNSWKHTVQPVTFIHTLIAYIRCFRKLERLQF